MAGLNPLLELTGKRSQVDVTQSNKRAKCSEETSTLLYVAYSYLRPDFYGHFQCEYAA
jgi:hypothetical protein